MHKKSIVRLSDEERVTCQEVVKKLKGSSQKGRRAQILLQADADGPVWSDERIGEALGCRVQTLENVRKRVVTESVELALNGKKRQPPPTLPKLRGEGEATLIARRLGHPPTGLGRWTLHLLAAQLVKLEVVESICPETVRQTLKKTACPSVGSTTGSLRQRTPPSSWRAWKKGWKLPRGLTSQGVPSFAWMHNPCSCSQRPRHRLRPPAIIPREAITNTSAQAPLAFACWPNLLPAFGKPPPGRNAPKPIGPRQLPHCLTRGMPTVSK
jgi:Homeodomain-like domain